MQIKLSRMAIFKTFEKNFFRNLFSSILTTNKKHNEIKESLILPNSEFFYIIYISTEASLGILNFNLFSIIS